MSSRDDSCSVRSCNFFTTAPVGCVLESTAKILEVQGFLSPKVGIIGLVSGSSSPIFLLVSGYT